MNTCATAIVGTWVECLNVCRTESASMCFFGLFEHFFGLFPFFSGPYPGAGSLDFFLLFDLKMVFAYSDVIMLSVLASQFNPLGILAPCLLKGKLILQKAVTSNLAWDDKLPDDIISDWKTWAKSMQKIVDCYSIPRYCFGNEKINKNTSSQVKYQLHGFCNASNYAFSCVVYLRQIRS